MDIKNKLRRLLKKMKRAAADELIDPLNDRSYLTFGLTPSLHDYPAMLGEQERVLPSYLAAKVARAEGSVVELGCYLGGSTVALLEGLQRGGAPISAPEPSIHAYDLFVANEYMTEHTLGRFGVQPGDSFEYVYRQLLGERLPLVEVHAGDILQEQWNGGTIKLLYVDILWSWETNQHVFDQFYRALTPGSWLVHQDYVYSLYPWLPVTMEWLVEEGFFTFRHFAEHSTVAFRCERNPAALANGFVIRKNIDPIRKQALIARSANRFSGYPSKLLRLSMAVQMAEEGHYEAARAIVAQVTESSDHSFVKYHADMVLDRLRMESAVENFE